MESESISPLNLSQDGSAKFTHVLSLDIGGTLLKAGVVDRSGRLVSNYLKVATPRPATPSAILTCLKQMIGELPAFERVAVGFPGAVREARIVTAPNLGTEVWCNYPLADRLAAELQKPVRLVNDAILHGFGSFEGKGVECILTLGTGMGCALFKSGWLFHGLELGQHYAIAGKTYDQWVGQRAFDEVGVEEWNKRVETAILAIDRLTNCHRIFIGGGNAKRISAMLPAHVAIANELSNLAGGAKLWLSTQDVYRDAD